MYWLIYGGSHLHILVRVPHSFLAVFCIPSASIVLGLGSYRLASFAMFTTEGHFAVVIV